MASLLSCNRVHQPTTVRTLARAAQLSGVVSLRELISQLGPAGFGPRPFNVVGHNTNTIAEVGAALEAGATAIEPDVNVYQAGDALCISHGRGDADSPSLVQFLESLHTVASARSQLALVVFDCKTSDPKHGRALIDAIRTHLTHDIKLNVIISVADLSKVGLFAQILTGLGPREGLMIDEEYDPFAVSAFFKSAGVNFQGFGNGSTASGVLGPNVRPSMEAACATRAAHDEIRFIYAWTINDDDLMREYIRIGIDGMISDDLNNVRSIMHEFPGLVRLAKRADNPFLPANAAYGLTIQTADGSMAGTDANVTFTIKGSLASATVMVNTKLPFRMEHNQRNFVTLQSPDLGEPVPQLTVWIAYTVLVSTLLGAAVVAIHEAQSLGFMTNGRPARES